MGTKSAPRLVPYIYYIIIGIIIRVLNFIYCVALFLDLVFSGQFTRVSLRLADKEHSLFG